MIDGVLNNAPSPGEVAAKESKPKKSCRAKPEKPSIRAQLKAAKEGQQPKAPTKDKSQDLEV